jgi:nicotinate-nucleotide adenylyltransferase
MGNRKSAVQQESNALASPDSPFPIPHSRPHLHLHLHLYYGGTFDPIHDGHLAIARAARDELGVPVNLIPAADPPHRAPPGADAAQRTRMLELALADEAGLVLDRRELERARHSDRPSYTIDTLTELREELGAEAPIAWLLGADSLLSLDSWHRWRELVGLTHLVVAERQGASLDAALPEAVQTSLAARWVDDVAELALRPAGLIWRLRQPLQPESASEVRGRIAAGEPWHDLVPAAVARYIEDHRLYRGAGA